MITTQEVHSPQECSSRYLWEGRGQADLEMADPCKVPRYDGADTEVVLSLVCYKDKSNVLVSWHQGKSPRFPDILKVCRVDYNDASSHFYSTFIREHAARNHVIFRLCNLFVLTHSLRATMSNFAHFSRAEHWTLWNILSCNFARYIKHNDGTSGHNAQALPALFRQGHLPPNVERRKMNDNEWSDLWSHSDNGRRPESPHTS